MGLILPHKLVMVDCFSSLTNEITSNDRAPISTRSGFKDWIFSPFKSNNIDAQNTLFNNPVNSLINIGTVKNYAFT